MVQKINCPWCGAKIENKLSKLADHIFKAHSDNFELCAWAKAELEKIGKQLEHNILLQVKRQQANNKKAKYTNKPVGRIPPSR